MRLLFDENLSFRLIAALAQQFPDSAHVRSVGLQRADDLTIWRFARDQGVAVVTLDADFFELSVLHGAPPKILWLRCLDTSTPAVLHLIATHEREIRAFESDNSASCIVLAPKA